jgi:hypothetical protein
MARMAQMAGWALLALLARDAASRNDAPNLGKARDADKDFYAAKRKGPVNVHDHQPSISLTVIAAPGCTVIEFLEREN